VIGVTQSAENRANLPDAIPSPGLVLDLPRCDSGTMEDHSGIPGVGSTVTLLTMLRMGFTHDTPPLKGYMSANSRVQT